MKTELTLNVLQTMNAQEYEDIRAAGSDERRELTHAVMRELDAPDNWTMNGEYGSEFRYSGGLHRKPSAIHWHWRRHWIRRGTALTTSSIS